MENIMNKTTKLIPILILALVLTLFPQEKVFASSGGFTGTMPPGGVNTDPYNPPPSVSKRYTPAKGRVGSQENPKINYVTANTKELRSNVSSTRNSLMSTYKDTNVGKKYASVRGYSSADSGVRKSKLVYPYTDDKGAEITHIYEIYRYPEVNVYVNSTKSSLVISRVNEKNDWTIKGKDFEGNSFSGGFKIIGGKLSGGVYTTTSNTLQANFYRTGKYTITFVPYQRVKTKESSSQTAYGYYYYRDGHSAVMSGTSTSSSSGPVTKTEIVKRNDYFQKWEKIISPDDISEDPDPIPVPDPENPTHIKIPKPPIKIDIIPGGGGGDGGSGTEDTDVTIIH